MICGPDDGADCPLVSMETRIFSTEFADKAEQPNQVFKKLSFAGVPKPSKAPGGKSTRLVQFKNAP